MSSVQQNGKVTVKDGLSQTPHNRYTYEDIEKTTQFLQNKIVHVPQILIIFGSGLGRIGDILQDQIDIDYKDIPNFPQSTVKGHPGKLVFGSLSSVNTVCMLGRFHYYEGYSLEECTVPIRALALLGVKTVIVTNAGGAVNPAYKTGDMMFIKDHINFSGFSGNNPLRGPNDPRFGPRFLPMTKVYDKSIMEVAKNITSKMGLTPHVHEGIYAMVGGPTFETIAEVNLLKTLGADAVGMSTVPEVLIGKHAGMSVFGLTFVTNMCVSSYNENREPNHEEVLRAVTDKEKQLKQFFTELVGSIGNGFKK